MRGFTLIELLIGVTLVGVLLALGVPAMGSYLQNSKLATAASGYFTGLQLARAEAIRRNVQTQFVLTDTVAASANVGAVAPNVAGRNWFVRAASGAGFDFIEAKSGSEGEGSAAAQAIQIAASGPLGATIAFNGFGAIAGNAAASIDITNPAAGICAPVGPVRCRRITVSPSGRINICDPAAAGAGASSADSRAC